MEKLSDTAGRLPKNPVEFTPSKQRRDITCLMEDTSKKYPQKVPPQRILLAHD